MPAVDTARDAWSTRPVASSAGQRGTGPVGVGLVGAGMISTQYLDTMCAMPDLQVVAVGDLDEGRARARADEYSVGFAGSSTDVIEHPDVEIVVNLTIPTVHAQVSRTALEADRHVWSEKPIATTRADARALVELANRRGRRLGVAPDTILGPGMCAASAAIRDGAIGVPVAATAVMQYAGPDLFHPAPEFLFATGGGPLFDMGPYYVSSMVSLFGPVDRVSAIGTRARTRREIAVGPRAGTTFDVEVPTHVAALLEFRRGQVGQLLLSFDSPLARFGVLEITGTTGTLATPDPNTFDAHARITRSPSFDALDSPPDWQDVAGDSRAGVGRGIGVLDMARALRTGAPHAASGELALHVLDVLLAVDEAVADGGWHGISSDIPSIADPLVADPTSRTL